MMKRFTGIAVLAMLVVGSIPAEPVAAAPVHQPGSPVAAPAAAPKAGTVPSQKLASQGQPSSVTRTDRVLVHWDAGHVALSRPQVMTLPARAQAASKAGEHARFVRETGSGASVYQLDAPLGQDADEILTSIRAQPGVASVEPDLWVTADALPNDPAAANMWGVLGPSDGPNSTYGINALGAWGKTTGSGIVVAVVDTGIVAHPDLAGQTVAGYDMVSYPSISNDGDGRDANPTDPGDWCAADGSSSNWHGTHVAGIIAAVANNSVGIFGGAPGVKIQPVRVLGQCGGYVSDISDGIRWASGAAVTGAPANATPAKVINVSLGGDYPSCLSEYQSAIDTARSRGSVVVVAAGNESIDAAGFAPANCSGVVTVAATNMSGQRAYFSNVGATVEIAAPGVGIESTVDAGTTVQTGYTYKYYDGTSMAAPHVALTAALIASAHPSLTPDGIAAVLEGTAKAFAPDATSDGCPTLGCGAGIVNAAAAVASLASGAPAFGPISLSTRYLKPGASFMVRTSGVDDDGIAAAAVSVNGGPWSAMSAVDGAFGSSYEPLQASVSAPVSEGTYSVCVRATDGLGNTSDGNDCTSIIVDGTPPAVAAGLGLSHIVPFPNQPERVTGTATDSMGVAGAEISVDGGAWKRVEATDGSFGSTGESLEGVAGLSPRSVSPSYHTCAIATDATLWCWGANDDGEVGDGTTAFRQSPVQVSMPAVDAVSSAPWHTCALSGGAVWCWGWNAYGQLGDGTTTSRFSPVQVPGLSGVVRISTGPYDSCAVLSNGTVRCWGYNGYGGLGDGTTTNRPSPVTVAGLSGVTAVAPGRYHTCALMGDGTARCWGYNGRGALGDGTGANSLSPVQVSGLSGAVAIGAGEHTCALLSGGTVTCWGRNSYGEVGDGTSSDRLAPVTVSGIAGASAIAIGWNHSCALVSGSVRCWGNNWYGQLGDGSFTNRTTAVTVPGVSAARIGAGADVTCAMPSDGSAYCWGYNEEGELDVATIGNRAAAAPVLAFGGLNIGTHSVCLRATDVAGNVGAATCASVTTAGVPSAPTNVTATPGNGQAQVWWVAATEFGVPVAGYVVSASPGGQACTTAGALTCVVGGLSNGTAYTFRVYATSGIGNGPASASSGAVVPAPAPGAPGTVVASGLDGAAYVGWTPAAGNGAPSVTYTVTANPGGQTCTTTGLSCTVGGLTNGISYTFSVQAATYGGTGVARTSVPVTPGVKLDRYSGPDRFAAAAAISARTFGPDCGCVVYIATAYNFPDALAGAAAAGTVKGPVLLVAATGGVNAYTAGEIDRLKPVKIVVLGGTVSVGTDVYSQLAAMAPSIVRYSGADRFEAAANISKNTFAANCGCTVYIATAYNFPDALAGAAAAGTLRGPVLLVAPTGPVNAFTAAEIGRLAPARIIVLGGSASVGADVYGQLGTMTLWLTRYSGVDRFQSAATVSHGTFGNNCNCVAYISTAYNFPDALAGAAAAASIYGPVLLVNATGPIDAYTAQELRNLQPRKIVVLGGPVSVGADVYAQLAGFVP